MGEPLSYLGTVTRIFQGDCVVQTVLIASHCQSWYVSDRQEQMAIDRITKRMRVHTHMHMCVYMYIYIYIYAQGICMCIHICTELQ